MTNTKLLLSVAAASVLALNGCGGGSSSTPTTDTTTTFERPADCSSYTEPSNTTLSGDITTCTVLTSGKVWTLDGQVAVKGTTLQIEAGTTIIGRDGTAANAGWLIIDRDAKIIADGTSNQPIIFTSELAHNNPNNAAEGQWGGLTIIGNAADAAQNEPYEVDSSFVAGTTIPTDNSGILDNVQILNSGSVVNQDQELNGLSLVGVGSGTQVTNITVENSNDDGIELWGGTVNLSNIDVSTCHDDHFDIDDGYAGTVTNLTITQTSGNAAIEMSGDTYATFTNLTITQTASDQEGGIFFKGAGIGGHFDTVTVTDNVNDGVGAIHSNDVVNDNEISFTNVTLNGTSSGDGITGTSEVALQALFDADITNTRP